MYVKIVSELLNHPLYAFPISFTVHVRWHQLKILLKKSIIELNIFKNDLTTDHHVRYQRYATRLYIIILIISVAVLAFFSSLSKQIHRETVLNPTKSEYGQLRETYPNSLVCPCTSISMNYSTFITIQPHYHQVCSSDIVTTEWIDYNFLFSFHGPPLTNYEFHAGTHFQSLAGLCTQAKETIDDALRIFLNTQYVGASVVPQKAFESQMQSFVRDWQQTTVNRNLRTIQLVRATNEGNQLLTGMPNVNFHLDYVTGKTTMQPIQFSNCSCALSQSCRSLMAIYEHDITSQIYSELFSVPNFYIGCYLVDGLLASTLECFYNRSCMMEIDRHKHISMQENFNFTALDPTLNAPDETVVTIVSRLMIDSWPPKISYSLYYNTCAPVLCTFDENRANDPFSVVNTIIGAFGGLSLGFKLFILIAIRILEKFQGNFSCRNFMHVTRKLFSCRNERQMTDRLHFFLVLVTLSILYSFSAFAAQSVTKTIDKPSLFTYQDLDARFPGAVHCLCAQASIQYQAFLTIQPSFHQVCSSDFVTESWIRYLYGAGNLVHQYPPTDFWASAIGQFQSLASLCQLSNETVSNTLTQFLTSSFISQQLLSPSSFNDRIQQATYEVQITMPNLFINTLSLIRETTSANMLMNTASTNWIITTPSLTVDHPTAHIVPLTYQSCECGLSAKCVEPSRGMLAGCYPLEALLRSTLECFYEQNCIDSAATFIAMNPSTLESSRFRVDMIIESIVSQLFVEEYSSNMSYGLYFAQCAPSSCTYSYIDRVNTIAGLTYLIALYGGSVIICRWIAMVTIQLFLCRKQQVSPILEIKTEN